MLLCRIYPVLSLAIGLVGVASFVTVSVLLSTQPVEQLQACKKFSTPKARNPLSLPSLLPPSSPTSKSPTRGADTEGSCPYPPPAARDHQRERIQELYIKKNLTVGKVAGIMKGNGFLP